MANKPVHPARYFALGLLLAFAAGVMTYSAVFWIVGAIVDALLPS